MEDIKADVVHRLVDPEQGMPPEMRAVLRTKLDLGPEPPPVTPSTNAAPEKVSSR
jgi:hypothetical protein